MPAARSVACPPRAPAPVQLCWSDGRGEARGGWRAGARARRPRSRWGGPRGPALHRVASRCAHRVIRRPVSIRRDYIHTVYVLMPACIHCHATDVHSGATRRSRGGAEISALTLLDTTQKCFACHAQAPVPLASPSPPSSPSFSLKNLSACDSHTAHARTRVTHGWERQPAGARAWSVRAAADDVRIRNVDLEHAPVQLGPVHVVDGVLGVSPLVKLHERKAPVLRCERAGGPLSPGRGLGDGDAAWRRAGRSALAVLSTGRLTSITSPTGTNAARRMSSVTLSSNPPACAGGCDTATCT
jgi:hypothetical protein